MGSKSKGKKRKKTPVPKRPLREYAYFDVSRDFARAIQYHQAGHLTKADQIYTKILRAHPDFSDCLHLKGFLAHQSGKNEIAIRLITKAIEQNPTDPVFHYNLSLPLLAQHKLDEAISCLRNAIRLNPELIQAHINLGNVLQEQGRPGEAICHYEKAYQLNPDDPLLHVNMGNVLESQGKFTEAVSSYKKALSLKPDLAEAHYNMGNAYKAQGKIEQAVSCYQKAVATNPGDSGAYYNMANTFQELNRLSEAKACYQKAIEIGPERIEAYYQLGNVFKNEGNFEEALSWYRKSLTLKPDCAEAFYSLARAMKVTRENTEEIFGIGDKFKGAQLCEDDAIYVNFALGKIYDDLGRFDEAFRHYREANRAERSRHTFDPGQHREFITKIIQFFDVDFFSRCHGWGDPSQKPIFIVGMPRSGTSLVEQIVSSHPKAFGAGELSFFFQYEKTLASERERSTCCGTYPEYMERFDKEAARALAGSYLELINNLSGPSGDFLYVTDKMPHNFLYLGLLYAIFPKAKFIHCHRHPLDNCLSIFFQKFSQSHPYAYDLRDLGLSYGEYRRLMAHWDEVIPTEIFQVQYEDLVSNQEAVSRQLIAFCGLEWEPRCLAFYRNDRPVFTSSNWQVRQPIYQSSSNRWRHYARYLDPLKELLHEFL